MAKGKTELHASPSIPSTIICLLGTSRCGSTLLQSVLANTSSAIALGEIARVHDLLHKQSDCACGDKLAACAFWTPALRDLIQTAPLVAWSNASWLGRGKVLRGVLATITGLDVLAPRAERDSAWHLAQALATFSQDTGSSLFIDSSKDPQEFLRLALLPSYRVIPVHLVRDPRGVAWSAFRRTGIDPITMAKHWARLNRAIARLTRLTQAYPWQFVRYEDFCRDPRLVCRQLLEVAGGGSIRKQAEANHALGGSPGFFLNGDSIVPDERWKAEMPEEMRRRIMQATGSTAGEFGYT